MVDQSGQLGQSAKKVRGRKGWYNRVSSKRPRSDDSIMERVLSRHFANYVVDEFRSFLRQRVPTLSTTSSTGPVVVPTRARLPSTGPDPMLSTMSSTGPVVVPTLLYVVDESRPVVVPFLPSTHVQWFSACHFVCQIRLDSVY